MPLKAFITGGNVMNEQPNYGNWVPKKLIVALWVLTAVAVVLLGANLTMWHNTYLTVIFIIALVIVLFFAITMQKMHNSFSFTGGGLMKKIHEFLISRLDWDGKGKILDIGCGSGALTIRCAKAFPEATAVGLDYWGAEWDYAKEHCIKNSELEGVKNTEYLKGDARQLPYGDGEFDAVVSNFVFHEVKTEKDKRKLVKEALRVLKKGGSFSLHDMFETKRIYGDMNEFIEELKKEGISEIHYEPHTENLPFVPKNIKIMFKDMGIIYGKK